MTNEPKRVVIINPDVDFDDEDLDDFPFDDEDDEPFDVGGPGDDYIPDETEFIR